ncbi:unnamed protein product [Ceratitis capitata]|uniref:(Mediterranean fruit fly) hypothetical protein n=1 Tax=Ceratitis capitata TaxID=7213 RepID=A0A811U1S6_CERCA|nr:unnamed protein product [Ceratitis capitata]
MRPSQSEAVGRRETDGTSACQKKKPRLTTSMQKKRLEWARQHRNMTVADWDKVCFSDESTFEILVDKSSFVRRRPGEQFRADCLVERLVSSQPKGWGVYISQKWFPNDEYCHTEPEVSTHFWQKICHFFALDREFTCKRSDYHQTAVD